MKFADPADAPEAKSRLEALTGRIPGLLSLDAGLDVLGTEASYDLSLVTTHETLQGLDDYSTHPEHLEFRSWVGTRLSGRVTVDSEE